MIKEDYYLFGLAILNIFVLFKSTTFIDYTLLGAIINQTDVWSVATFVAFLAFVMVALRNLAVLSLLIIKKDEKEDSRVALTEIAVFTIVVLALHVLLVFFDAFVDYNQYGIL